VAQLRTLSTDLNRAGQNVHKEYQDAMSGKTNDFVNQRFFDRRMDNPEDIAYWSRVFASTNTNDALKHAIYHELLRIKQSGKDDRKKGLTAEQERIVQTSPRKQVMVVQAYAGTGKTTTLYHYAKKWSDNKILYLAYNKVLADESKERFKDLPHVTVTTIHALAKRHFEEILVGNVGLKELTAQGLSLDVARQRLEQFHVFCASDLIAIPEEIRFMFSGKVPHDAYLKQFQMKRPTLDYDIIMLDEVQDCTDCILDLVLRQTHATRLFVGDVYQKIYGFRHVGNPFEYILNRVPNARGYYLSVAFRFGFDLMRFTNLFLLKKYNETRGFSKSLAPPTQLSVSNELFPGLVVICRYNLTALKLMLESDLPMCIVGKNIDFAKEIQFATDLWFLQNRMSDLIASTKVARFETLQHFQDFHNAHQNIKWKNRMQLVQLYGEHTADLWRDAQRRTDSENGVMVVTAHQAKGSEYDHVMVYDDFTGSNEDAHNTLYVAMTRGKKTVRISPSLLRFFEKHTPRVSYPFDTKQSAKSTPCSVCRKRFTNLTVCTEDDPVSVLQGKECELFEYIPMCNQCNK
jgi:superfamily I DNA/RNA helicase